MKTCCRCKERKPRSEFTKCARKKDGLNAYCRPCNGAVTKEWKSKNREKNRENYRKGQASLRAKRPWYYSFCSKLSHAKKHASKNGYICDLTVEFFENLIKDQNGRCALSGIPMTCGEKGITPTSASMDKMDRTKGYVIGNVRLLCHSINSMRLNMSDEEFWAFVDSIKWNR